MASGLLARRLAQATVDKVVQLLAALECLDSGAVHDALSELSLQLYGLVYCCSARQEWTQEENGMEKIQIIETLRENGNNGAAERTSLRQLAGY